MSGRIIRWFLWFLLLIGIAIPCFASWTEGKEDTLKKLITERILMERRAEQREEWDYTSEDDYVLSKVMKNIDDESKQELLKELINDKINKKNKDKQKHQKELTIIDNEKIALEAMKQ